MHHKSNSNRDTQCLLCHAVQKDSSVARRGKRNAHPKRSTCHYSKDLNNHSHNNKFYEKQSRKGRINTHCAFQLFAFEQRRTQMLPAENANHNRAIHPFLALLAQSRPVISPSNLIITQQKYTSSNMLSVLNMLLFIPCLQAAHPVDPALTKASHRAWARQ